MHGEGKRIFTSDKANRCWFACSAFVKSVRSWRCRGRAQQRLDALNTFLTRLGRSAAAVRAEVAAPALLSPASMGARPGVSPCDLLDASKVATWPLQEHHTADFLLARGLCDHVPLPEYARLEPVAIEVPLAYKVAGHRPQSHWGCTASLALPFEEIDEAAFDFDDDVTAGHPWKLALELLTATEAHAAVFAASGGGRPDHACAARHTLR